MKYWYILYEEFDNVETGEVEAVGPSEAAEKAVLQEWITTGNMDQRLAVAPLDQVTVFNSVPRVVEQAKKNRADWEAKETEAKERAQLAALLAKYGVPA